MLFIRFFIDMTAYWDCTNYSQLKFTRIPVFEDILHVNNSVDI